MLKNYIKSYGYLFGIIILLTIIISIMNFLFTKNFTIIKIIIPTISVFISAIFLGKTAKEKAYLEGLKFGTIYLLIVTILKLVLKQSFNYKVIIMYLVIIISSLIGSMIGINLKSKN